MIIGLVGKPNVGKSTTWSAATLAAADIGDYPFTTIDANKGVGFVRVVDPGPDLGVTATPRTGRIVDEGRTRLVPVDIIDVAGLVPGAHEGKGLGNKFLNDIARADALVHVVDASGNTDAEGNPGATGHDPLADVAFLPNEIDAWIRGLVADGWDRFVRRVQQEHQKLEVALADRLSGIKVDAPMASAALRAAGLAGKSPSDWPASGLDELARCLRRVRFPIVVALNKADLVEPDRMAALEAAIEGTALPLSAQSELALGRAAGAGVIAHVPGSNAMEVVGDLSDAQRGGLDYIQTHVLDRFGGTGLHKVLEAAAFDVLRLIPTFPVEDDHHFTDKEGRVLPDCHLVPQGTTAKQLAYRVHTDLGDKFVRGIDCRTKRVIGADHVLATGDVIKIAANT